MGRFASFDPDAHGAAPAAVHTSPLTEADLDDVARLAADREGVPLDRARASWRRTWERRRAPGGKTTLVARAGDGALAGFGCVQHITVEPGASLDRIACPSGWYLAGLVVDPAMRRRGIGARLVGDRLLWLAERGVTRCHYVANELNLATIALHARFAFEPVARGVWLPGVTFEGAAGVLFGAPTT